jgi:hypothetical protein
VKKGTNKKGKRQRENLSEKNKTNAKEAKIKARGTVPTVHEGVK